MVGRFRRATGCDGAPDSHFDRVARSSNVADDLQAFGVLLGLVAAVALEFMLVTATTSDRRRIVGVVIVMSVIGTLGYAVVAG